MALFLIEVPIPEEKEALQALFEKLESGAKAASGELIEIQVGRDAGRVFAIFELEATDGLDAFLRKNAIEFDEIAPVRLVGAELEDLKAKKGSAGYLVEWDFPENLTMEQYLSRKKEKAPLYAQVPETTFLRTYVREDMVKCLCLYDAPDEEAVRRAREVVDTPIDRLSRLGIENA